MSYVYQAPLRCVKCGIVIEKKVGAKTPRYCPTCRTQQQNDWRASVRSNSGRRS